MRKIVINTIHGGFGLSPLAIKRYLELNGQECYFFENNVNCTKLIPLTLEEATKKHFFSVFTESDPESQIDFNADLKELSQEEQEEFIRTWDALTFCTSTIERDDEKLIAVVEELQEKANGHYAFLKIIEIPDDVDWILQDYDGVEWVAEKHRIWG